MLSQAVRIELENELAHLRVVRDAADRKMKAIEAVLQPDEIASSGAAPNGIQASQAPNGHIRNGKTFAAKVRSALAESSRPSRAAQVAQRLRERGIEQRGKQSLEVDVSVELHRMAKRNTGGVSKVGRGLYVIKERES
jgi:hypothetical protein